MSAIFHNKRSRLPPFWRFSLYKNRMHGAAIVADLAPRTSQLCKPKASVCVPMLRKTGRAPLLIAALLKQPCCRAFALLTSVGNCHRLEQRQQRRELAAGWTTMAPKRGHWQRKKEERSRSFAKRGRVGGFGAYGDQTQGTKRIDLKNCMTPLLYSIVRLVFRSTQLFCVYLYVACTTQYVDRESTCTYHS